jgi:hypothetical protein
MKDEEPLRQAQGPDMPFGRLRDRREEVCERNKKPMDRKCVREIKSPRTGSG